MDAHPNILLLVEHFPAGPVIDDATVERLRRMGHVYRPSGPAKSWPADLLADRLPDADIVITSWGSPKLTAELLAAAPRLRFIGHAAGTVAPYIDLSAWDRGITVVSGNAAMSAQVAEWAVALAIMALRRWKTLAWAMERGADFSREDIAMDRESLCDQTVGIVGLGPVARHAIRMFAAFNCRLLVTAPESAEVVATAGGTKVDLPTLLRQSRVVSLHAPQNEQTERMIGAAELALLADGAVLVNTARGRLVDHDALVVEAGRGRLLAALDVTWPEQLAADHPLRHMDNVILSPHCAGPVPRRRRDFGQLVVEDLEAFLSGAGRPLKGRVTVEQARQMTRR